MSSRPFEVVITGNPDNVKSVKSFKWITETTEAPIPNNIYVESRLNNKPQTNTTTTNPVGEKLERQDYVPRNQYIDSNKQQDSQDTPVQKQNQSSNSTELPDFMNNLPDNFN